MTGYAPDAYTVRAGKGPVRSLEPPLANGEGTPRNWGPLLCPYAPDAYTVRAGKGPVRSLEIGAFGG